MCTRCGARKSYHNASNPAHFPAAFVMKHKPASRTPSKNHNEVYENENHRSCETLFPNKSKTSIFLARKVAQPGPTIEADKEATLSCPLLMRSSPRIARIRNSPPDPS